MNFFNDKDLATRFKNNNVPQRERFFYYFLFMVLIEFIFLISIYFPAEKLPNTFDKISDFGGAIIGFAALFYWYNINSTGDNREYIERSICLGVPVIIKTTLYFAPVFFVSIILVDQFMCDASSAIWLGCDINSDDTSLPVFLFVVGANIFFYYRMTMMFKIAASSTGLNEQA